MTKIFLSYRRGDSAGVTGRIDDRLVDAFGRDAVFKDVDSIPLGMDFRKFLAEAVGGCDVVLVVIGEGWLWAKDESGNRRLDDDADFVRIEVETALQRNIPVVPVLLGNALMPKPEELPKPMRELSFRNATKVRPDPDFNPDMTRIVDSIKEANPPKTQKVQKTPTGGHSAAQRISVACQCGKKLRAPEKLAGKSAKCPDCGASVKIPAPTNPSNRPTVSSGAAPLASVARPTQSKQKTSSSTPRSRRDQPPSLVKPGSRKKRSNAVPIIASILVIGALAGAFLMSDLSPRAKEGETAAVEGEIVAVPQLSIVAWGRNDQGQTEPPPELSSVTKISGGGYHSLALKEDGTVVAWGFNRDGQTDIPPGMKSVTAIAAGRSHSLALKEDGTVVAWGYNGSKLTDIPPELRSVTAIAAGYNDLSLALKEDGTVVAWGYSDDGETTVPDGLKSVTAIAAGRAHWLALKEDGTVVAWGKNLFGETYTKDLKGVTAIAAGFHYSLALKKDGTVVAWGDNNDGKTKVPDGLKGVTAIAASGNHSLALKEDGTVIAWGKNDEGQTKVPEGLKGVTAIAAGHSHNLALYEQAEKKD